MSFDYQQIMEHKEVIKNTLSRKSEVDKMFYSCA